MVAVSPYATALSLNRPAPIHVAEGQFNVDRVRAYATYEDVWNNVPEAFNELLRAGDDPLARRYLPAVRGLIESTNRYLATEIMTDWTVINGATVSEDQLNQWMGLLGALWAREEVSIKLMSLKRWGLIRGDSLLMISADPAKLEGTRIRITEVDPSQYFPIIDPSDGERVLGCYLASIVKTDDDDDIIQRIEYRRILTPDMAAEFSAPLGSVFYRVGFYELDGWDDRDDAQELTAVEPPSWAVFEGSDLLLAGTPLPPAITSIPVYHMRNNRRGGQAGQFGTSEIQGLESLLAGLIQNATDEDAAVALQGLGVYWTDSGRPRDAQNREVSWEIGPASMIELEKDGKMGRVEGVGSVQPILDHINMIKTEAREAVAVPDVAVGRIGDQAASSGVALRIEFMPILAKNAEKEQELASKLSQLLFDLQTMWYPAYETWSALPIAPSVVFGDPIPTDRKATLEEVTALVTAGLVSKAWATTYLKEKLGYDFPADMLATLATEQAAELDAMGTRLDAAATADTGAPDTF